MLPQFSYSQPDTVKKAAAQLQEKAGAALHAGGSDLLGCLREGILAPEKIVSISHIESLKGIKESAKAELVIGSLTTITEIAENPVINERYPALAKAASEVASPQLRNQGTIGGNLCQKPRCWYYRGEFNCLRKGGSHCFARSGQNQFHAIFGHDGICFITHPSDTAPVLTALGAHVVVQGPESRRRIPVEELHIRPADDPQTETVLLPGEIITQIVIPPPLKNTQSSYRKVRARRGWDFALAGAAFVIQFEKDRVKNASIVLSGAAPIPWRSTETEKAVIGKKLDNTTISRAAEASVENARPLVHNRYKVYMFKGVVQEELTRIRDKNV